MNRDDASRAVADPLGRLLAGGGVSVVASAGGSAPPPRLAYLTRFPRLTVAVAGVRRMAVARAGRAVVLPLAAGTGLYVPAMCWNRPLGSAAVCDLTLLLGQRHVGVSLVDRTGGAAPPRVAKASVARESGSALDHPLQATESAARGGDAALLAAVVTAALHACRDALTAPAPPDGPGGLLCESARLYVQEHAHRPITRDAVAAHFDVTPNHLSRLFHRAGGDGFSRTLTAARVDRAKVLLGGYGTPLKEVARQCGFASTAYFCRTFKRVTGRTPTGYRLARRVVPALSD